MKLYNLSLNLVFISCMALASYINPTFAQNSPQDFVDAHNQAREQVGAGLPPMSWDQGLQNYAQNYANRVQDADTCDQLEHSGGPYGENLADGSPDITGQQAVALWVGEKGDYNYDTNSCAAGKDCGHYTQVVWRNSVRLGCARVHCNNGWSYVICSYDPRGNIDGERPY